VLLGYPAWSTNAPYCVLYCELNVCYHCCRSFFLPCCTKVKILLCTLAVYEEKHVSDMFFCHTNNHAFLNPCVWTDAHCYSHWTRCWVGRKVTSVKWTLAFKALAIPLLTELSWTHHCHLLWSSCLHSHKSFVLMYHLYTHSCGANPVITVSCLLVAYSWTLTSIYWQDKECMEP